MIQSKQGLSTFSIIWLGQVISIIGSGLTSFALGVWVYERSGSTTQFALLTLAALVPGILVSPMAGALVDRWNRRWVMIMSDTGAAVVTLIVFILMRAESLALWHLAIAAAVLSILNAFQIPAYHAATTMLVPQKFLGRASGMTQAGQALGQLVAPALAGALLVNIQLVGIVIIDFITFFIALLTMLFIRFPEVDNVEREDVDTHSSLIDGMLFGWRYLRERRGLVALLTFFAAGNFLIGFSNILITPLVLSFASPDTLGKILSIGGVGMLAGSIVLGGIDSPTKRIYLVLVFALLSSLSVMAIGISMSPVLLTIAAFCYLFCVPMIVGNSRVIIQRKVAAEVQGRVFAFANAITQATTPLAYVLSGPLADYVFEPALAMNGSLADSIVGQVIGVGPGRGIGLLIVITGILLVGACVVAYRNPRLRNIETELPDIELSDAESKSLESVEVLPSA